MPVTDVGRRQASPRPQEAQSTAAGCARSRGSRPRGRRLRRRRAGRVRSPRVADRPAGPGRPGGGLAGWALFRGFGYASFLFPLLLGALGGQLVPAPLHGAGSTPARGPRRPARHGDRAPRAPRERPTEWITVGSWARASRTGFAPRSGVRERGWCCWQRSRWRAPRHSGLVRGARPRPHDASCPHASARPQHRARGDTRDARARRRGAWPCRRRASLAAGASSGGRRARPARAPGSWNGGSPGRRPSTSARAAPRHSSSRRWVCSRLPPPPSSRARARSCRTTPRPSAASCKTSRSRAASSR